jgi:hypothetical protein
MFLPLIFICFSVRSASSSLDWKVSVHEIEKLRLNIESLSSKIHKNQNEISAHETEIKRCEQRLRVLFRLKDFYSSIVVSSQTDDANEFDFPTFEKMGEIFTVLIDLQAEKPDVQDDLLYFNVLQRIEEEIVSTQTALHVVNEFITVDTDLLDIYFHQIESAKMDNHKAMKTRSDLYKLAIPSMANALLAMRLGIAKLSPTDKKTRDLMIGMHKSLSDALSTYSREANKRKWKQHFRNTLE